LPVYLGHYKAHTGRAGGGDMINLQNLPVRDTRYEYPIRQALCAPPDHECISADLSQIEARVLAWLAGQDDIVDAFQAYDEGRGPDIYCVTASTIFGRPITRADEKERFIGKVVRLALGYGMSHVKFARVAKLKPQEAQTIVERHRQASRHIVTLWYQGDSALHCMHTHKQGVLGKHGVLMVDSEGIHLPMWGRVIRYPHLTYHARSEDNPPFFSYQNRKKLPHVYGAKVIENVVQALAGIIVAEAWLRIAARGITVVLQVHDELVCVAHKNDVERWLPVIREEMTRVPDWAPGLPVACTIGHHPRYGLAKG
jgi:DNA polymerase